MKRRAWHARGHGKPVTLQLGSLNFMPQLIHTLDSHVDLVHEDVTLFSYVYRPQTAAIESPRPYFYPLRTLKGNVVSGFRPHDHRWHHGLSMTCANLSGHNFWGGPTCVRDKGYVQLDNNGGQIMASTNDFISDFTGEQIDCVLVWQTAQSDVPLIVENRNISTRVSSDFWSLNFKSHLSTTKKDEPLIWGSPTTQGRENAGYGGLFWRGPRDFVNGQILMSDNREGADLMGQTSPWLAYIGQHDETDDYSTLIFVDDSENPRHPTPWFVRNTTPVVCPYFAFHEEYEMQSGEGLELNYRIIIADGKWDREQIEAMV